MSRLFALLLLGLCGCQITATAYIERDLPDGRAVAKVETVYRTPEKSHEVLSQKRP